MKRNLLLFVLFQVLIIACGQTSSSVTQLGAKEFSNQIQAKSDIVLLDVRTDKEYQGGHIKNAINLNLYQSGFKKKLLAYPKDKDIYVYCYSGARSSSAAKTLISNGYKKVYNLQRGIIDWNANKLPLEKPTANVQLSNNNSENSYSIAKFNTLINSGDLVFIDFYAPWCAPCKKMMPTIDELKKEYSKGINIVKINTDQSKELTISLKILSIPYLALYYKGELLFSKMGTMTKEELEKLFETNIEKYKK